jgi:hypothetical protein
MVLLRTNTTAAAPSQVWNEMKKPNKRIGVALLFVALFSSLALNVWCVWQIYYFGGWRDTVQLKASMQATLQALDDYKAGILRIYTVQGQRESPAFTGRHEGPFEVWSPQFYPSLGPAHRLSTEEYAKAYNNKMRYMYDHPDRWPRPTNVVQTVNSTTVPDHGSPNAKE